jgi:hypothetical protein
VTGVSVTFHGPLFDGRADVALEAFPIAAAAAIGDAAYLDIRRTLGRVLRNPTGFYESRVQHTMAGDQGFVHDSNVIYGPWLEGTGSRNATTRFKGYHTFRLVTQRIDARCVDIAQGVLDGYLARMR